MRLKLTPKRLLSLKIVIHLCALVPLCYLYFEAFTDQLGGDPVEAILHFTGLSAFKLVLLSLCVSPLAKVLKSAPLIKVRRLIGLYAFAYAFAHFASYILFELQMEWSLLISEIIKRPYITVGFAALCILLALAVTSTQKAQRSLGRKWQSLHNLIYLAVLLIALHFIWSVKSDIVEPAIYGLMTLTLLFFRKDKIVKIFTKRLA